MEGTYMSAPSSKLNRAGDALPQAVINDKEVKARCNDFWSRPGKDGQPRQKPTYRRGIQLR
jgi:hypothetical protein